MRGQLLAQIIILYMKSCYNVCKSRPLASAFDGMPGMRTHVTRFRLRVLLNHQKPTNSAAGPSGMSNLI